MAMQSSSSSFSYRLTYDVFLSFRGEDTRHGFTGNLYKALHDKGIHTFIDDQDLHRGDWITSALEKAIQESRIFIIFLSQNYTSSSFCLNELAYILNFIKGKGLLVLLVFYYVDLLMCDTTKVVLEKHWLIMKRSSSITYRSWRNGRRLCVK